MDKLTPQAPKLPHLQIPQPLKGEVKVEVQFPPEVRQLAADLHDDRAAIGAMGVALVIIMAVAVFCLAAATAKYIFGGLFARKS